MNFAVKTGYFAYEHWGTRLVNWFYGFWIVRRKRAFGRRNQADVREKRRQNTKMRAESALKVFRIFFIGIIVITMLIFKLFLN